MCKNIQFQKLWSLKAIGAIIIFSAWISQNFLETDFNQKLNSIEERKLTSIYLNMQVTEYKILYETEKIKYQKNKELKEQENEELKEQINKELIKKAARLLLTVQKHLLLHDKDVLNADNIKLKNHNGKKQKSKIEKIIENENIEEVIKETDIYFKKMHKDVNPIKDKINEKINNLQDWVNISNKAYLGLSIIGFLLYGLYFLRSTE